jgi:lysophospholipase L1-like esterase
VTELQTIDFLDATKIRLAGVLHLEPSITGGYSLHRLPGWTQPQVVDPALVLIRQMPSGCRLEVVTDATAIELDVQMTVIQLNDDEPAGGSYDLEIDGQLLDNLVSREGTRLRVDMETGALDFQPGGPTTIRFDGMPAGEKLVKVWLPNAATVDLIAVRLDGSAAAPPLTKRRWVHYGSSISHCVEAKRPTGVWPVVASRRASVDLQNLGLAGQCQLDGFTARTIRDLPADLISCKLGINIVNGDTMRERTFVPAVHNLIDTIREGHPDTPLVIITPIFCAPHEDGVGPSLFRDGRCTSGERPVELATGARNLKRNRELHAEIVSARRAAGDANLHLMSGLDLFGPDDAGDLPDDLHPNPAGYQRMGERFFELAFGPGGPFAAA